MNSVFLSSFEDPNEAPEQESEAVIDVRKKPKEYVRSIVLTFLTLTFALVVSFILTQVLQRVIPANSQVHEYLLYLLGVFILSAIVFYLAYIFL